jgi:hypothetical protein
MFVFEGVELGLVVFAGVLVFGGFSAAGQFAVGGRDILYAPKNAVVVFECIEGGAVGFLGFSVQGFYFLELLHELSFFG